MQYQWYPGHMTKARRMMQENLKLIDIMIELVDARVPSSSRNPDINSLAAGKARLIILNKKDMADPDVTKQWEDYYREQGFLVASVDSRKNTGLKEVRRLIGDACRAKKERDRKRGILNRPVRAMIAGIPNVGKSTFINSFAGKASAKTGNRPGVTKGKQWIKINKDVELLDTPGILWPRFEDQTVGLRLAMIGSIRDEILNKEELAIALIDSLKSGYPGALESRYGIKEELESMEILRGIAESRGCVKKGGEADIDKASKLLTDDFRACRLGKISLEKPEA
ncbi:MAG: ribosome biogenesis GTPase YlqF [Eubacterium sp.]|nr:ribosome biogenesis GTPase YlqF [Eubacterium sp.]